VCVLGFGLVSCATATGPETPAALKYADNHMEWCTPIKTHPDLAVGIAVDPAGDEPITIKSIDPVDISAMRIDGTWVVPIDLDNRIGTNDWPIPSDEQWWSKRQRAAGATLKPGEHHDVILHVHHTGPGHGSLRDVKITYEQNGETRTADTHIAVRMAEEDC